MLLPNPTANHKLPCPTTIIAAKPATTFEVFQKMSDDKLTDCPLEDCDGPVKRLLGTGGGIIFKGGGFYETDYRSKSYTEGAKKEKAASEPKKESKSKSD